MKRVRIPVARQWLPANVTVVPVSPGHTLAVLYCARYLSGSSLEYSELIVAPGLIRVGWRPGAWISNLFVDDERSVAGGKEIWGLDKQLARFDWTDDDGGSTAQLRVTQDAGDILSARWTHAAPNVRIPMLGLVLNRKDNRWLFFTARGVSDLARSSVVLNGGISNICRALGLEGAHSAWLATSMQAVVSSPRYFET